MAASASAGAASAAAIVAAARARIRPAFMARPYARPSGDLLRTCDDLRQLFAELRQPPGAEPLDQRGFRLGGGGAHQRRDVAPPVGGGDDLRAPVGGIG